MSRASFTNNRSASLRDGPAQPHSAILQFSLSLALRRGNNGIKFMRPSTILTDAVGPPLGRPSKNSALQRYHGGSLARADQRRDVRGHAREGERLSRPGTFAKDCGAP
jgi:hypothetical protein